MKKKAFYGAIIVASAGLVCLGGCSSSKSVPSATTETDTETVTASKMLSLCGYDVSDYVTLPGNYMSLEIDKVTTAIGSEDDFINDILAEYPVYVKTDEKEVKNDSCVNITYAAFINGAEADGLGGENEDIVLGAESDIETSSILSCISMDDLAGNLTGVKTGGSTEFTVKADDESLETYKDGEPVAGKEITYHVSVNAIEKETTLTKETLTDDFVKENLSEEYGTETAEEFLSVIGQEYESEKQSDILNQKREAVMKILEKEAEVTIPDGLVDSYMNDQIQSLREQADVENSMSFEDFSKEYLSEAMSEEEFKEEYREEFTQEVTDNLICEAIIKERDQSVSGDRLDFVTQSYMTYYGYETADDVYDYFGGKNELCLAIAIDDVKTLIAESAVEK